MHRPPPRGHEQAIKPHIIMGEVGPALHEHLAGAHDAGLLPGGYGMGGVILMVAGFNLDKDYLFPAPGDDINLTHRGAVLAGKNMIALYAQIKCRDALPQLATLPGVLFIVHDLFYDFFMVFC